MRPWLILLCCLSPAAAEAQWYLETFTGVNHTRPSTIAISLPEQQFALEFENVPYDAKPMKSPQYYGARLGKVFGRGRGLGLDVEFLHVKLYARTDDVVRVHGTFAGQPLDDALSMKLFVDRYNHTHGLNFLFANLAWRVPLGAGATPAAALLLRGGVGLVRIGRDVVLQDLNVQGYQIAGIGAQFAAELQVRLKGRLGAMGEYKLTHAHPELKLTDLGRGRLRAVTHHLAFGITIQLTK